MNARETEPADLTRRVRSMITSYVHQKTESKSGITWDAYRAELAKDAKAAPVNADLLKKYRSDREKICQDAFLAMRSRHTREDFVSYFVGTICAVPQRLPESDYRELAAALLRDSGSWHDIKSLSMLALSALADV